MYPGFAVVLTCAVRAGLTEFRVKELTERIQVPRQTLERWCIWWQQTFANSAFFKIERGRLGPLQIDEAALPVSLLLRFEGEDLCSRLQGLLRFLAPLSKGR